MKQVTIFCVGEFVTTSLEAARGYAQTIAGISRKPVEIKRASVVIRRGECVETCRPTN